MLIKGCFPFDRHGNRLDAADKRWHLSSPTPYDPPLTYGGWLQARQVGHQISNYIEQAKVDAEGRGSPLGRSSPLGRGSPTGRKRKRFRVIVHSSPFLRCVQTSIAITSGLSQLSPEAGFHPSNLFAPVPVPAGKAKNDYRSSILRLDPFLGEWLSHEYFENITPPPSSSLMLGTAKADLLKREDYSAYTDFSPAPAQARSNSLWSGGSPSNSPGRDADDSSFDTAAMTSALPQHSEERKGYAPPRPTYAVSSAGKIPEGFVAHARDACLAVDYQWDSMGQPLNFGDGAKLGEEWTAMHKRFRGGLKRMLNWYATAQAPGQLVSSGRHHEADKSGAQSSEDDDVETILVIVSHGAGCNALIGAITHQPVLMDVGIASITMAVRKPDLNYAHLQSLAKSSETKASPYVAVDQMYDMRLSASTEHLHSTGSTPVSSRSASNSSYWNQSSNPGPRGRTSTLGSGMGPSIGAITYSDPFSLPGSRSTSASAAMGTSVRRDSAGSRTSGRQTAMASTGLFSGPGASNSGVPPPGGGNSSGSPASASPAGFGLWTPTPSSLRLMDDGSSDPDKDEFKLLDFEQPHLKSPSLPVEDGSAPAPFAPDKVATAISSTRSSSKGPPHLAGPIKLQTNWGPGPDVAAPEEVKLPVSLGDGVGGLWGQPRPPGEAERHRDLSRSKRRWTVNEQRR